MSLCVAKDGRAVEGNTYHEIAMQIMPYRLDHETRSVFIKGIGKDTVTYSAEFSDEEFMREAATRVMTLILRSGWRLYRAFP